jgi:hypothetical protein
VSLPDSPFTRGWQYNRTLLDVARSYLGQKETAPNSGPMIDVWLSGVGQPPGKSWCAAYAYGVAFEAASKLDLLPCPCPRTASALRMWELCQRMRVPTPTPGCLGFSDHGAGKGHVFFVEEASPSGHLVTISGNTNSEGSREGNAVARHEWDWLLGLAGKLNVHGGRLLGFADLTMAIDARTA